MAKTILKSLLHYCLPLVCKHADSRPEISSVTFPAVGEQHHVAEHVWFVHMFDVMNYALVFIGCRIAVVFGGRNSICIAFRSLMWPCAAQLSANSRTFWLCCSNLLSCLGRYSLNNCCVTRAFLFASYRTGSCCPLGTSQMFRLPYYEQGKLLAARHVAVNEDSEPLFAVLATVAGIFSGSSL